MAIQHVPTMRVTVNPNPKGSATTHVTMAAANPFERGVSHMRSANQPNMRNMMPGMGNLGEEPAASATSAFSWGKLAQDLTQNLALPIAGQWLQKEINGKPAQNLQTPQPQYLPSAPPAMLPTNPAHAMPVINVSVPPQSPAPQGGGMANTLPWIIGGVALLGVGAIFLAKRKK